jgi:dolichol-phosphate mannosyltransferase
LVLDVLVVDDNSPDGTGELADSIAAAESQRPRACTGRRSRTRVARTSTASSGRLERDYEFIFEMDADFSHNPSDIPSFLEAAKAGDCRSRPGVALQGRHPGHQLAAEPTAAQHRRGSLRALDHRHADLGSDRRVQRVSDGAPSPLSTLETVRSNGYSFQIELTHRIWRRGGRIAEVPIIFTDRFQGTSKMSKHIVREALWMVWRPLDPERAATQTVASFDRLMSATQISGVSTPNPAPKRTRNSQTTGPPTSVPLERRLLHRSDKRIGRGFHQRGQPGHDLGMLRGAFLLFRRIVGEVVKLHRFSLGQLNGLPIARSHRALITAFVELPSRNDRAWRRAPCRATLAAKDKPSVFTGRLVCSKSAMVGSMSRNATGRSEVVPGLMTPGHRTMSGTRMPPSYRSRLIPRRVPELLKKFACTPPSECGPLSLVKRTTVS